jgi:hypothetical protein
VICARHRSKTKPVLFASSCAHLDEDRRHLATRR